MPRGSVNSVIRGQVLDATRAYYAAFGRCDLAATMACWSRRADIACVPPLSDPGFGWDGVEEVYRGAFTLLAEEIFEFEVMQTTLEDPLAVVTCAERATNPREGHVNEFMATNLFVLEREGWRLLHRHISWRVSRELRLLAADAGTPEVP